MTTGPDHLRLHTHWTPMAMVSLVLLAVAAAGATGCRSSDELQGTPKRARKTRKRPAPQEPGEGYLETLVRSKKTAETTADKVHMKALSTNLTMHAVMHDGRFPAALKDLGNAALLKAPGSTGQPYRYIAGQTSAMPRTNVLVYEEKPVHQGGRCLVLRVGGTIDLLTPDQLKQAVAETQKRLGK
jgi:hypothetical protein